MFRFLFFRSFSRRLPKPVAFRLRKLQLNHSLNRLHVYVVYLYVKIAPTPATFFCFICLFFCFYSYLQLSYFFHALTRGQIGLSDRRLLVQGTQLARRKNVAFTHPSTGETSPCSEKNNQQHNEFLLTRLKMFSKSRILCVKRTESLVCKNFFPNFPS